MTCTSILRRIPSAGGTGISRVCCSILRRAAPPYPYQPETITFLDLIGVVDGDGLYYEGTAQEITGNGIWLALDNFIVSLKNAKGLTLGVSNLSTKFDAIYPMIGGTASAHKYNLCNPVDSDAAFRLTFSGGWTHSRTGALPNGTNAYANSHFIPNTNAADTRSAFGIYSRVNDTSGTRGYGVISTGANVRMHHQLVTRDVSIGNAGSTYAVIATTQFLFNRKTSSTLMQGYRNGTTLFTYVASTGTASSTHKFHFASRNVDDTSNQWYSTHEIALGILVGIEAISDSEAVAISTAVNNLQAALFRNV